VQSVTITVIFSAASQRGWLYYR